MKYTLKGGSAEVEYDTRGSKKRRTEAIKSAGPAEDGYISLEVLSGEDSLGSVELSEVPNPMDMIGQLEYWIAGKEG